MLKIDISNEQPRLTIDEGRLRSAIAAVLAGADRQHATISVAIVDDPTIHELNRRYLAHDYPTDVLSFLLEDGPSGLDGEIVVSADTAARVCDEFGSSAADELLLYVIHGALHLVGYDDVSPTAAAEMRRQEQRYMADMGINGAGSRQRTIGLGEPADQPALLGKGLQT